MRYLILSDPHANGEALLAVLRSVRRKSFAATCVLGDLVGYGASPNQVVERLTSLRGRTVMVRGNHDKVVAGVESGEGFNQAALDAAFWSRDKLTQRNLHRVGALPEGPVEVADDIQICHGSPAGEDRYLFDEAEAVRAFAATRARLTFFGHTHIPSIFATVSSHVWGALLTGDEGSIRLQPGVRYLVNPGSIGQPRDGNPKASYVVYDAQRQTIRWRRVGYDVAAAQKRIVDAGLPQPLAERLALGL